MPGISRSPSTDDGQFQKTCRANLETALSGLSLYIKASYEVVLALVLGVGFHLVHFRDPAKIIGPGHLCDRYLEPVTSLDTCGCGIAELTLSRLAHSR